MSSLIVKQVAPGGRSETIIVPITGVISHDPEKNQVVISIAEGTKCFDLAYGSVYVMNDAGRTIDTYRTNGRTTPTKEPEPDAEESFRIQDFNAPLISMFGNWYINIDDKTYRVKRDTPLRLTAVGCESNNPAEIATLKPGQRILATTTAVGSLFQMVNMAVISHVAVEGELTLMDFRLVPRKQATPAKSIVSLEAKLRLFGPNFRVCIGVDVIYKGKVYTGGLNGELHYVGLLGA